MRWNKEKFLKLIPDAYVALLLIACLWVPDLQKVLGRVYVWDQFNHWDANLMLPGWAYLHQQILNSDVLSSWGMGSVITISRLAQILGGFDYTHVLMVMMTMVIIYYAALYLFLKAWLRSPWLSAGIVAVAIKLQMFHSGITPLIWLYPEDTNLHHWLDIPVLWWLWRYTKGRQQQYLLFSSLGVGAAMAWSFSTGLCLWLALAATIIDALMASQSRLNYKQIRKECSYLFIPFVVMIFLWFCLQGHTIFSGLFWQHLFEPFSLFWQGTGVPSFYACLYDRHFFAFIVSFIIPVIYVVTLMLAKDQEPMLLPLCVYGLGLYVHYLGQATTSHYYALGIPVVIVSGWWTSRIFGKHMLWLSLVAWSALLTNVLFIYYPNIFDISRMNWGPEVDFYQTNFSYKEDAAMIDRLTPPGQPAAVISSFETKILMQADRPVFFEYAPLVTSVRMDSRIFSGTSLTTPQRLQDTANEIVQKTPPYIYIEKRLLGPWPAPYVQEFPGISSLLSYISANYVLQEQGAFLVAMHRK